MSSSPTSGPILVQSKMGQSGKIAGVVGPSKGNVGG